MLCTVCQLIELDGRQTKYCSRVCERRGWREANKEKLLAGKKRYREANKEKISDYHKLYKSKVKHVNNNLADDLKASFSCLRCEGVTRLEVHHIKHQLLGGGVNDKNNLLVLCKDCHALWHKFFPSEYFGYGKGDLHGLLQQAETLPKLRGNSRPRNIMNDYKLPSGVVSIIPDNQTSPSS